MFDAMGNLKKIRSELKDTQIKNPKLIDHQPEITKLTGELENDNLKLVYEKLVEIAKSNLRIKGIDTVAGLEQYKAREKFL